jgi:hypothetical protein
VEDEISGPPTLLPRLAPVEQRAYDRGDLEHRIAHLDLVLRETRRSLNANGLPGGEPWRLLRRQGKSIITVGLVAGRTYLGNLMLQRRCSLRIFKP